MARTIRLLALTVLAACFALAFGCSEKMQPSEGSETHFLTACNLSCASGADCLCGVCTKVCAEDAACASVGDDAACVSLSARVAEGRCDQTSPPAMCDIACLSSDDCAALGSAFRCESGYCRQEPDATPTPASSCQGTAPGADDLVVLGDALIQYSSFTADLEQAASNAGLLGSGEHYRDYASSLLSLLASGPLAIANQYTTARAAGPARVIVLDGGETDVLNVPCGSAPQPDCSQIQAAAAGAETLLAEFAADGVEHVVYFFYGDPVGNTDVKAGLDVLRPFVENACGRAKVACHFLDLRPIFAGHPEYAATDGLVFSDAGAAAAASAVFSLMNDRCITGAR